MKVEKEGRTYYMSLIEDEGHQLSFEADTIQFNTEGQFLIIRNYKEGKIETMEIQK